MTAPNQLKWKPITGEWLARIETVSASLNVSLHKANEFLTFQMELGLLHAVHHQTSSLVTFSLFKSKHVFNCGTI